MFYSREILARKASLGQIWLLGTRQEKPDRRKANKLDIARLCEEILNPPVPIALRLSSILMGGVVILYEKKVMFLQADANRLLFEIRKAWKVMDEPTLLPKTKSKAKRKSITLPENEESSMGFINDREFEEEISMGFQQNNLNMQLDQVDDSYFTSDPMVDNMTSDHHQANDDDITLPDLYQPNTNTGGQFERFEEVDEGAQANFTMDEHIQIATTPIPSPARQDEPQRAGGTQEQQPENQFDQQFNENKEARDQQRQGPVKRKTRKAKGIIIDEEQTLISNHVYHSWLHDTSDIASRTGRKKREHTSILSSSKIAKFMELPATALMDGMLVKGNQEIPYPEPLLDLWKNRNQPSCDSPSVKTSQPQPQPQPHQQPSSTERVESDYPMDYAFEDIHSGAGSQSHAASIELRRTPARINDFGIPEKSGDAGKFTGSSASEDAVPFDNVEENIGRVGSKKNNVPPSASRKNVSLDTVAETNFEADLDYKLSSPNKKVLTPDQGTKVLTPDQELLVETQFTMETPADDPPADIMTENIKMHMKTHFETPGAPEVESLQNLAAALNRKGAAQLFYQTCVLASKGFLKVEQEVPFGDILISKGAKM